MITAEIKVNGVPIALVYVVNESSLVMSLPEVCSYRCEVHECVAEPPCRTFHVDHRRSDGWPVLLGKVLEAHAAKGGEKSNAD